MRDTILDIDLTERIKELRREADIWKDEEVPPVGIITTPCQHEVYYCCGCGKVLDKP